MALVKSARTLSLLVVGLALAVNSPAQSFLTNGLVAYFPFSGSAADASGNGHDGTAHGAVLTTNRFGEANRAYYFDGTSAYITAPLSSTVFSNDFTASVWFDVASIANGWPTMLDEENMAFRLQIAGDDCGCSRPGNLISYLSSGGLLAPPQRTPVNTFLQVVVTKAGTSLKMYVNGQIADTNQVLNPNGAVGQYLTIGRLYDMTSGNVFRGVIDDVRIYSRALSVSEVLQLYAYELEPQVALVKAVKPSFSSLAVGASYQLQISTNLNGTFTNYGSPFTATNTSMVYPQYFDVLNWGELFFRLH